MHQFKGKRPEWRIIERVIRGDAGIVVSELPLLVPRYSFKVGTARIDQDTGEMYVTPYLTVFNAEDAQELLIEMVDKYARKREAHEDALNEKRKQWEA